MNTNCVLWDPTMQLWSGTDVYEVQMFVRRYFIEKYNMDIVVTSEKIYFLLNGLLKNMRPRTGDIFTRCNLDDSIPDQFFSKLNLMEECVQIIISQIEYQLEEQDDCLSVWYPLWQYDNNFFTSPKIDERANKEILSMRF
jgi:hypothetical protein